MHEAPTRDSSNQHPATRVCTAVLEILDAFEPLPGRPGRTDPSASRSVVNIPVKHTLPGLKPKTPCMSFPDHHPWRLETCIPTPCAREETHL
jgi:hypothetical protein